MTRIRIGGVVLFALLGAGLFVQTTKCFRVRFFH
jgi:hypothetical protein